MARMFRQRIGWQLPALMASESLIILGSIAISTSIRLHRGLSMDQWPKALLIASLCQLCLYYTECYDFRVLSDRREVFVRLIKALGVTSLIVAAVYFWLPSMVIGPGVFFLVAFAVITGLGSWRMIFEWCAAHVGHRERLLLVGTGAASLSLAQELHARKELGVEIVGFIDPAYVGPRAPNAEVIGTVEDIPRIANALAVDRVVVGLGDVRGRMPMEQLLDMKLEGVVFDYLASVYEEFTGKIAVENLRPSWLIFSDGFRQHRTFRGLKRLFDVIASILGLFVSAPLIALTAATIKLTSDGPALFAQKRVGKNGRIFTLYKFRSMRTDAESGIGAVWARENDPRVTPVGRFLRKSRLDELPQFWNVLRGDMSLVGPRPERPEFVGELTTLIPFYRQRHVVHPGLTGWAQVKYQYGSSVEDALQKLQYDLFYIKNQSLGLDLYVAFKTIKIIILRRGAQ
jgi:sugar transferase (PEP-CTERM system associated)